MGDTQVGCQPVSILLDVIGYTMPARAAETTEDTEGTEKNVFLVYSSVLREALCGKDKAGAFLLLQKSRDQKISLIS